MSRRITQVRRYVEEAQGVLGLLDLTIKVTDEQRRVVVHELLHCHMAAMVNLKDDLEKTLGTAAFDILDAAFERAHERTTDKLARLMAPLLPLPPKFGRS